MRAMYGALAEDVSFCHILDLVAGNLRSHISAVHFDDFVECRSRVDVTGEISAPEIASLIQDYAGRWRGGNTWMQRGLEKLITRGYGDGDEVVGEKELLAMPYYQHYLRRVDVRHGLGICLWHAGAERVVVASFNRAPAEGPFSKEEMGFVAAMRPHLVNAFMIYKGAAQLRDCNRSLMAAMDMTPAGMMQLDTDGKVLKANERAEKIVSSHMGVAREGKGSLSFDCHGDRLRFHQAVKSLCATDAGVHTLTMVISASNHGMRPTLLLHLCALPSITCFGPAVRLVAFLCPLASFDPGQWNAQLIGTGLGLTTAEARVLVALRRHHDVDDAAAELGVATSTVRTHLKHAFAKTGASGQAELLAIVERIITLAPSSKV